LSDAENPWAAGWAGDVAARWLVLEAALERALGPFGAAALARAQPAPGERVIDVGCGAGGTLLSLADAVGSAGQVLGVDIAPALLARARERVAGRSAVTLLEANAELAELPGGQALVFSRFGVMFFGDPARAFANLARSLVAGGRLAFVCWRRFEENPWLAVPFAAARTVVPEAKGPPPTGPGPFSFGDAAALERLLAGAGFGSIAIEPFDRPVLLGDDRAEAVRLALGTGPTAGAVLEASDEVRSRVAEAVAAVLPPATSDGVRLPGAAWVVTARKP
jgi:SAM-dependent methyltransferase